MEHGDDETGTDTLEREDAEVLTALDRPWVVIVWNDPVNLMSYVSYVFRTVLAVSAAQAHKLMLTVHNEGRAAVATGPRERMEILTVALHGYGLSATIERAPE